MPGLLSWLQAAPLASDSYVADLLRTLLALLAVCVLGFFGLRWLARRGFGGSRGPSSAVQVLARIPLDARKSLYLVRAGKRVLLIGTGDAGPPALIAELDPSSVEPPSEAAAPQDPGGAQP
jgi:flagellar biogenesis protein FliO